MDESASGQKVDNTGSFGEGSTSDSQKWNYIVIDDEMPGLDLEKFWAEEFNHEGGWEDVFGDWNDG